MEDFSKDDILVLAYNICYRLSYSTGRMLALLPPVNNIIITSCRFSLIFILSHCVCTNNRQLFVIHKCSQLLDVHAQFNLYIHLCRNQS